MGATVFAFLSAAGLMVGLALLTVSIISIIVIRMRKARKLFYLTPIVLLIAGMVLAAPAIILTVTIVSDARREYEDKGELYRAAEDKEWGKVRALIEAGAHPDGVYHITPLMEACEWSDVEMVEYLISKGADINKVDNHQHSVIHYSIQGYRDSIDVFNILLNEGVNIPTESFDYRTFFMHLARYSEPEFMECYLIHYPDCDIYAVDDTGWSAMHYAASERQTSNVAYLIDIGLSAKVATDHGDTPLMLTCPSRNSYKDIELELVELLLDAGGDPYLENNDGESTVDLYSALYEQEIARIERGGLDDSEKVEAAFEELEILFERTKE